MARAQTELKFTYSDYEKLPATVKQYQVIEGKLLMTPAPVPKHQKVLNTINILFSEHVNKNNLGEIYISPCDVVFSEDNIVQPDLLFISKENLHIIKEKNIQGVPDLVVEILSEGTEKLDKVFKKSLYEKFGVKEYWMVDIQYETMEVFYLAATGQYESSGVLKREDPVKSKIFPALDVKVNAVFV